MFILPDGGLEDEIVHVSSLILDAVTATESEIQFLSTDVQTCQVSAACRLNFEA
jgi:hypothetical protein